jgi:hypothetical protein
MGVTMIAMVVAEKVLCYKTEGVDSSLNEVIELFQFRGTNRFKCSLIFAVKNAAT